MSGKALTRYYAEHLYDCPAYYQERSDVGGGRSTPVFLVVDAAREIAKVEGERNILFGKLEDAHHKIERLGKLVRTLEQKASEPRG